MILLPYFLTMSLSVDVRISTTPQLCYARDGGAGRERKIAQKKYRRVGDSMASRHQGWYQVPPFPKDALTRSCTTESLLILQHCSPTKVSSATIDLAPRLHFVLLLLIVVLFLLMTKENFSTASIGVGARAHEPSNEAARSSPDK
ncbi:hypothetical protein F5146DRAFT_1126346 [Armillaria mellea]|nr:hypothetical protein F5146DRAFT_1126346 [Armillaria mellea]